MVADPQSCPGPSHYALIASLQPARRAWTQAANHRIAGIGLSTALGTLVVVVARLGGASQQKRLSQELGVSPAALVRTIDQGEAAGLLTRTNIDADRRGKLIRLSRDGLALAARMEAMLDDLRSRLLGGVPADEIDTTIRVLRTLGDRANAFVAAADATDHVGTDP